MSFLDQSMEKVDQGDLSDVVRGGGGGFRPSMDDVSAVDSIDKNFQELSSAKVSPFSAPRSIEPAPVVPPATVARPPGVKRRKAQAKNVICIPAPAADQEGNSSKTSGVVVPSDLWAWRKYGQKPIKGSPYPRGYYRCSSSKGCLARKQVERSRTDPNMLVITYTSEHNHPWPTHRNSLAGSSRSTNSTTQPSKSSKKSTSPKNEAIKEERVDFELMFNNNYEPLMLDYSNDMKFFDELGGLEPNPMSFFFNKLEAEGVENKDNMDVLSCFDWNHD